MQGRQRHSPTTTRRLVASLAAIAMLTSGCLLGSDTSGTGNVQAGSLAEHAKLNGTELSIGSKEFTEQLVLCEITALALQSAGADVTRKCGLSGSNTTRQALLSGNIDIYWEYTGTAWISYLTHITPIKDSNAQYHAVAKEDLANNKIAWLDKAAFNNTYGIAVTREYADKTSVTNLSNYAKLANNRPTAAKICVNGEFSSRDDGLPGVEKHYRFTLPNRSIATLETGSIYKAVDNHNPCNFGVVTTTDGRIKGLGLTLLTDDRAFFPIYNAAPNLRQTTLDQSPDIAKALNPIAEKLTLKTMQTLNGDVDIRGEAPRDVAQRWLQDQGFVGK